MPRLSEEDVGGMSSVDLHAEFRLLNTEIQPLATRRSLVHREIKKRKDNAFGISRVEFMSRNEKDELRRHLNEESGE